MSHTQHLPPVDPGLTGVVVGRGGEFLKNLEASEHPPELKRAVRDVHTRHELSVVRRAPSSGRPMARRLREQRPRVAQRTSSSSTTSSADPGDPDSEGPEADAARLRAFLVRLISFDWPEALIDRAYAFSVDIERQVTS